MYEANLDITGLRIVPFSWNKAWATAASSCEKTLRSGGPEVEAYALASNLWYYYRPWLFFRYIMIHVI